jgi:hypothetical protein
VLRKVFGCKKDQVTREWRRLHKEKLTKYYSGDQIKMTEMGGACSTYERRGSYRVLVGKVEGERALGRPSRGREDNIKIDFHEWEGAWIGLIWLRLGTGNGLL